jgi:hypothetical protein
LAKEVARAALTSLINHHRAGDSPDIAVLASARSGSTWVMEMIASVDGYTSRDEPDHPLLMQIHGYGRARQGAYFVDSNAEERNDLYRYLRNDRILRRFGPTRFSEPGWSPVSRRRILKLTRVAPIFQEFYDESGFSTLGLLRHPVAQSLSCLRSGNKPLLADFLGKPRYLDRWLPSGGSRRVAEVQGKGDLLARLVCEWALANIPMLWCASQRGVPLLRYEDLIRDPAMAPQLVGTAACVPLVRDLDLARRPSKRIDYSEPHTAARIRNGTLPSVEETLDEAISDSRRDQLYELLVDMGVDEVYFR